MTRLLDYVCAAVLLGLAGLKLIGPLPDGAAPLWAAFAVTVESLLGVSFALGRAPRASAIGLTLLGAGFCVWATLEGPLAVLRSPCPCFGPLKLGALGHLLAATAVLALGGIRLQLLRPPGDLRGQAAAASGRPDHAS